MKKEKSRTHSEDIKKERVTGILKRGAKDSMGIM